MPILRFLTLLRDNHFIHSYYILPEQYNAHLTWVSSHAKATRIIIFFKSDAQAMSLLTKVQIYSHPSRQVFVTYDALVSRAQAVGGLPIVYVLNTVFGLKTHREAVALRIGGQLVCLVQ